MADIPPPTGTFAKLNHLHDVLGKSILENAGHPLWPGRPYIPIGVPSVIRAVTPTQADACPMTCDWQQYSYDLICMHIREVHPEYTDDVVNDTGRQIFKALYRGNAFQSNNRGTDTRCDCINGANEDKDPVGLQPIYTGGNIVQVTGNKVKKYGIEYYPVLCFNGSLPPPSANDVNWKTRPDLVFWGTIETRILKGTKDRVIRPFGLVGIGRIPFFVIVQNSETAYINANHMQMISNTQVMTNNPYS